MSALESRPLSLARAAGISSRERRTVTIGAIVVAVALFVSFVVVPFGARWRAREALIDARAERLSRMEALAFGSERVGSALRARETSLAGRPQRLLGARSASLAASALQSLLQGYASDSRVQVSRVDVASAPDSAGGLQAIPATIAGTGDVHGLTALLERIEQGPRLLEIADVAVQSVRGPRGESLLQFSVGVRAPFAEIE